MEYVDLFNFIIPVFLILLGYIVGSIAESRHYASIRKREEQTMDFPVVTFRKLDEGEEVAKSMLVYGSVVISLDHFKRFLAALRNIFGGNITAYETLVDRGRREAILRMKTMAVGADMIMNARIETSSVMKNANRNNATGCIEVYAYGTAVKFKK